MRERKQSTTVIERGREVQGSEKHTEKEKPGRQGTGR